MAVAALLMLGAPWVRTAFADLQECTPPYKGAPLFVTEACIDPEFTEPVIEVDEWRETPVPHRYVNGRFEGTDTRFSFYFPPADKYEGRFFHYTLPAPSNAPGTEDTTDNNIAFGSASGAYYVQTNGGGSMGFDIEDFSEMNAETAKTIIDNAIISGYRADAAAAKFSRVIASEMYGAHRPYGYRYGGSGGSYKTISSAEHTSGVWDGYLPFVMGTPMTVPNTYSVRANALRVIKRGGKCATLTDNIEPGGSGDIYAGLNDEERAALTEATRFGFPPRGWYTCEVMNMGALSLFFPGVVGMDPTYFTDFWTEEGYLGTDPGSSVREDRVQFETEVNAVVESPSNPWLYPWALELKNIPAAGDLSNFDLIFLNGENEGKRATMAGLVGDIAIFEPYTVDPSIVEAIRNNPDTPVQVRIDNSNYLALQTYHRHQVPTRLKYFWDPNPGFYVFDQFRGPFGRPLYPQRPILVGPLLMGTGTVQTGRIEGKMIVMQTMMDIDALPWMADWYRSKVKRYLKEAFDDQYRLYYIDHADHGSEVGTALEGQIVDPGRLPTHIVRYRPVLEQLLRDLSAWVEQGIRPPAPTRYWVDDGQIKVPATAVLRKGIQPVIHLWANGGARAEVAVNEPVNFSAIISAPPDTGKVVFAQWDFEGAGDFHAVADLGAPKPTVRLNATYQFSKPGTYFPVLRGTSQRQGDPDTPWARIENLDRVRVIVK